MSSRRMTFDEHMKRIMNDPTVRCPKHNAPVVNVTEDVATFECGCMKAADKPFRHGDDANHLRYYPDIKAYLDSMPFEKGFGMPTDEKAHAKVNMAEAVKADDGKLPFDLIAWDAMQGLAAVLQFGAKKYAPRNWENGLNYSRVFAAAQRHMAAWFNGENRDSETGLSHIDHAMCCLMFLSAYEKRGQGGTCDDRPKLHKPMPLEGHHPGGC